MRISGGEHPKETTCVSCLQPCTTAFTVEGRRRFLVAALVAVGVSAGEAEEMVKGDWRQIKVLRYGQGSKMGQIGRMTIVCCQDCAGNFMVLEGPQSYIYRESNLRGWEGQDGQELPASYDLEGGGA
jgi:hypothetical protein